MRKGVLPVALVLCLLAAAPLAADECENPVTITFDPKLCAQGATLGKAHETLRELVRERCHQKCKGLDCPAPPAGQVQKSCALVGAVRGMPEPEPGERPTKVCVDDATCICECDNCAGAKVVQKRFGPHLSRRDAENEARQWCVDNECKRYACEEGTECDFAQPVCQWETQPVGRWRTEIVQCVLLSCVCACQLQ